MACNDHLSSLCTTGLDGIILTGIFVQLLREEFSSADNILDLGLKRHIWVSKPDDPIIVDPSRSQITIESVTKWDNRVHEGRPAVYVRRDGLKPMRVGIGMNQVQGGPGTNGLPEWGDNFTEPVQGAHTIFCIAQHPGMAEKLATEVDGHLRQFGSVFRDEFGFIQYHVNSLGAIARLEESWEHYAVPITIEYAFWDCWSVTREAPRFKGTTLNASPRDC